ncbi:Non-specific serine/threonine protein kinase protein [Dioscorea alata]|uniref:Non-specific serine/threonine protein kinase protein n=1 Tax=Dioscorea alata TaxID=55571 RepID=A0ACB7WQQ6_DIOAL|nr:Non-specific serine/threonine protein kinase protein [Dioscorea alata]
MASCLDLSPKCKKMAPFFTMSALNFLDHLNLSHNILSSKIPFGAQLQTFNSAAYNWNHDLCDGLFRTVLMRHITPKVHIGKKKKKKIGQGSYGFT